MRSDLPSDLTDQIVSAGIDVKQTRRLAHIFYRNVARRLWACTSATSDPPAGPNGWRHVTWLHPRAVWVSMELAFLRDVPPDVMARVREDMMAAVGSAPPDLENVLPGAAGLWCDRGLAAVAPAYRLESSPAPRVLDESAAETVRLFQAAVEVIEHCWPEAAAELRALVRCIVLVPGGEFYSASERTTFGAVYVGVDEVLDIVSAVEILLHETAHHSLFLKSAFALFVTNGDQISTHPLRPDPRPINGTLHAAYVLTRIAAGLDRWSRDPAVPQRAHLRRSETMEMLRATLATLRDCASWTEEGQQLFDSLAAQESALRGVDGRWPRISRTSTS